MQSNTETKNHHEIGTNSAEHITEGLIALPTGKVNISFSELRTWKECSWRHKLQQVDKIILQQPGFALDYGTSVHAAHENYIKTGVMDTSIATTMLRKLYEEHKFDKINIDAACLEADASLRDVPKFYDETFPGWKPVAAEFQLYERIEGHPNVFKGFIDAIITVPAKKKQLTWILDVKTTSWGWSFDKKSDDLVKTQLVLYKSFWSKKLNVDMKDIRCGFVLLKRTAKPGKHCELVTVSVGDKSSAKAMKTIGNMLASVKRGIAIKNRSSCMYCEFKGTKHCT